jgi:AraC-like DNA-binding protein
MTFNILNHLYFSLVLVSIVTFFDVFILQKNNKLLKTVFLNFITACIFFGSGNLFNHYIGFNRVFVSFSVILLLINSLFIFSILCYNSINKYLIIFAGLILATYLFIQGYFIFIKPFPLNIALNKISLMGNSLTILQTVIITVVFGIFVYIYLQIKKRFKDDNSYFLIIKKWSFVLLFCIMLSFMSVFLRNTLGEGNIFSKYFVSISLLTAVFLILFRPRFLNRSSISVSLSTAFNKKSESNIKENIFYEIFFNQMYFLNQNASISDLSQKMKISTETLYQFIYNNYSSGFNDLVNHNRILYFIELVKGKKYKNYTIDALAQLAGFYSRHHLYKPFKKFHGGVPSDFLKSLDY